MRFCYDGAFNEDNSDRYSQNEKISPSLKLNSGFSMRMRWIWNARVVIEIIMINEPKDYQNGAPYDEKGI